MAATTLTIGKKDYVVVPRKDYERLLRKAGLTDEADVAESIRRLNDPKEKRIPWSHVKKRAGLA